MVHASDRARGIRALGLSAVVAGLVAGCEPGSPLAGAGVELRLPSAWRPVEPDTWPVPGVPLAAWSGPDGSSLVVYRALPIPGGRAEALAEELANRLTNLPGMKVLSARSETLSGMSAARVEAIAPGTGSALAPSGAGVPRNRDDRPLVPTRLVVLGFPRSADTLFLVWHRPASAGAEGTLGASLEPLLRGLRIESRQAEVSSY